MGVGPVTAFSDRCEIVVHGKAAHSSEPQEGVDAVYIAASIIVALNTLVPKNLSPMEHSTLNMGMISGGAALNVITDRVEMHGMMRNAEAQTRSCLLYTSQNGWPPFRFLILKRYLNLLYHKMGMRGRRHEITQI